jgi:hypothetical protein
LGHSATLRFPSSLIESDVPISGIQLSDWLHREVHGEQTNRTPLRLGRTPIREALQRLSDVGLIDIAPRQGTTVTNINVGDQLLLLEVRRELEVTS